MIGGMKVKTSVTLSEDVLREIDELLGTPGKRSEFLEEAVRARLREIRRTARGARDIAIYERLASDEEFHRDVEENLELQEDLWNAENCTESLDPLETHEAIGSS